MRMIWSSLTSVTLLIVFLGCAVLCVGQDKTLPRHGFIGLRPLPRSQAEAVAIAGDAGKGLPIFDDQLNGKYPLVAEQLDVLMGRFHGDEFKTNRVFFEYYWGSSPTLDVLDPKKNHLVSTIKRKENNGGVVEHILICREYKLEIRRGKRDAKPGPFKEDTRILYIEDIDDIRGMFRNAHKQGILKHDNYKLIQMVEHPSFFAEDARVHPIIEKMDGVAFEVHQFNRLWPLETGWSKPDKVVKGAKWTLAQDKEYIFYYGPVIWKSKNYHPFIERDWLKTFWKAELPKRHPRMHYYLNLFPHAHGCGRPVGPESDPHSVLGFTKWLIQEIKMAPEKNKKATHEVERIRR
jgi:hypothetical protein